MPTPTKGPRLGGSPAHERLLLSNLATALFEHGKITTTEAKARRLRPVAERLITKAKRGDLHARRQVLSVIRDKGVVHSLFTEIGPRFENRPGGYLRITKIGPRKGDNAPMAVIELVEALTVAQRAVGEATAATRRSARDQAATVVTSGEEAVDSQIGGGDEPLTTEPAPSAASSPTGGPGEDLDPDQQVPGEDPAEGSTSPQTQGAGDEDPAEGADDRA